MDQHEVQNFPGISSYQEPNTRGFSMLLYFAGARTTSNLIDRYFDETSKTGVISILYYLLNGMYLPHSNQNLIYIPSTFPFCSITKFSITVCEVKNFGENYFRSCYMYIK